MASRRGSKEDAAVSLATERVGLIAAGAEAYALLVDAENGFANEVSVLHIAQRL